MREILAHFGLMTETQQGCSAVGKSITEFHFKMRYLDEDELNDTQSDALLKVRPDGVAFNEKSKICASLQFTRPKDSRDGASEQPD